MLTIIICTLLCVLVLNHLSKMLDSKIAGECSTNATLDTKPKPKETFQKIAAITRKPGQDLTFLHLPAEIRLQIYELALPESHPYIIGRDYGHSTADIKYPGLLQTNRQLRFEAGPIFFGANTFIVDIHSLKDLKRFCKWIRVLTDDIVSCIQDLRITVAGCLLVDVVLQPGRRKYGDEQVVATKPRLDNSLKWDRSHILHYVQDFEQAKPRIESLLEDVQENKAGDNGLRVQHLMDLVPLIFKVQRLDGP